MSNNTMKQIDPVFYPLVASVGHGLKGAINSLGPKPPPAPPAPPDAPGLAANTAAAADRAAADEDQRRRSLGGRMSTNPLGGLGDTSSANLASKSLLGG